MISSVRLTNIETRTPKKNDSARMWFKSPVDRTLASWATAAMRTPKIHPHSPAMTDRPHPRLIPRMRLLNQPAMMMNGTP